MSLSALISIALLAALQGLLVALPRADALHHLRRLRSPVWAALLPAVIVVALAPLTAPSVALLLVLLATMAAPLLLVVAVLRVIRGPRTLLGLGALILAVLAVGITEWVGELSASAVTALACLTLGVALARRMPQAWILVGVVGMCDVLMLGSGVGETATAAMHTATQHLHAPALESGVVGPIAIDYPDFVLAGLLGASVSGQRIQSRAAVLLTGLVIAYSLLLPGAGILPATVPIALTFVLLRFGHRAQTRSA